ncbi:hypothetical protein [Pseudomonas fontis]|uniref:Uncharacterized protein n=1 Tax=Pseudomonas fontis TaxID=2942633 RepID=A0ABT5NNN8_9PSED|nr:hypothetical protein [Pseudomonas fontis]MDD0972998.1 hypothetical protein [Pseudomonas fontis]MDD0989767.1 hypothetical protein [Pseudomonas fontis]
MTPNERANLLKNCLWTLEMLSDALIENDDCHGSIPEPQLTFRMTAGIHHAMRIISGVASEQWIVLQDQRT